VSAEVNVLLSLKKQYKDLTGEDFAPTGQQPRKPDTAAKAKPTVESSSTAAKAKPTVESSSTAADVDVKVIREQIELQGQKVRSMKAAAATKVMSQSDEHTERIPYILAYKSQNLRPNLLIKK